jgi:transketolase
MLNPNTLRQHVLQMVYSKKSGHIGGSFSLAECIAWLYSNTQVSTKEDRLILSKGHAAPILYAVFLELGLIDKTTDFRDTFSQLQGHPDERFCEHVHATTGSLGQGLSIAIGNAIGMKYNNSTGKVFCILGDGELNEGQCWEAIMSAPNFKLDNLVCFLDSNKCQNDGHTSQIMKLTDVWKKAASFGWSALKMDGHNLAEYDDLKDILAKQDRPIFIELDTVKGKGVSFMEGKPEWHSKVPNDFEYLLAMEELS